MKDVIVSLNVILKTRFDCRFPLHVSQSCIVSTDERRVWWLVNIYEYMEASQNGDHFAYDIFKFIFCNKCYYMDHCFTEYVPNGPIYRRLSIIWHKNGQVCWCIYASLGLDEF